jgi:hypothetical protein
VTAPLSSFPSERDPLHTPTDPVFSHKNRVEFVPNSSPARTAELRVLYAALGNIGDHALKAVPSLERAMRFENKLVVKEAQKSLDKLKRVADAQEDKRPVE